MAETKNFKCHVTALMESFRSEKGGNEGGLVRQMTFSKNKSSS